MARFDLESDRDEGFALSERKKTRRPRRFKVLLHNDDYTSMEFVVHILMEHFGKPPAEATAIMLQVHQKGVGVAGIYSREVAETKVAEVTEEARENGMPLKLTVEPLEEGRDEEE
jgi:ATP-dependent Clp protease adaptor protein ClpS